MFRNDKEHRLSDWVEGKIQAVVYLWHKRVNRLIRLEALEEHWRTVSFMLRNLHTLIRSVAMSVQKPEVIFVLGGPGSGKGTLCQKIVDKYGYVHLSAGDLLREERAKPGSQFGELIENHIKNGTIVPVEITCSLLVRAMDHSDNIYKRFLIDGFPRNQDNVEGWNKVIIFAFFEQIFNLV